MILKLVLRVYQLDRNLRTQNTSYTDFRGIDAIKFLEFSGAPSITVINTNDIN